MKTFTKTMWGVVGMAGLLTYLCSCRPKPPATLHEAITAGDLKSVKALIANGANVNEGRFWCGNTLLMEAVKKGHTDIVNVLISERAEINAKAKDGSTALMWATFNGDSESVKALLAAGADVNAALREHRAAIMKLRVDKNGNIFDKNGNSFMVVGDDLQQVAQSGRLFDKTGNYFEFEKGFEGKTGHGTALIMAAENGHTEIVKILLGAGANADFKAKSMVFNDTETALDYAKKNKHAEIVELLEKHKKR